MAQKEVKRMPEDMSPEEQDMLQEFIDNGCPGLAKITESTIFQWHQLYMHGKTYSEIAVTTRKKKEYVLFMAYKQDWMDKKMQYFDDMLAGMQNKLKQAKLESLNTVTTIVAALGQYYGDQFLKYMTTNDAKIIEKIDTKMLSQYYKSIEAIDKILGAAAEGSGEGSKNPIFNLNFNSEEDMTVEKVDNNTLNITRNTAGNLIKALADIKKEGKK